MNTFAVGEGWSDETNRDTAWTDGAISTPQQLAQFAYLVNTGGYNGTNNVWLKNDIDLGGKEWTPIGNEDDDDKIYSGLFDGNGFTISNMSITAFTKAYGEVGLYGLFGLFAGTVRNVRVTGVIECSSTLNNHFIGGIAGYSHYGKIINCISDVTITVTSDILAASDIGGIVGANYGEVSKCVNNGDIYLKKGNSSPVGGIAGLSVGIIDRCENHGDIEGYTTYIGGIVGYGYKYEAYYENPSVTNCYNTGNITDISCVVSLYYGGIVGYNNNVVIENCYNTGTAAENVTWGNLVGQLVNGNVLNNCYFLENGRFGLGRIGNIFVADSSDDQGTEMTESQMKASDFVGQLNGTGNAFLYNEGGYPVLSPLSMIVSITVTPADAVVVVRQNGSIIDPEPDGTYLLIPGSYEVSASADNYASKTETVQVTLHQNTHSINIDLDILPADYSAVDAAKAKIPSDLSVYTDDSVAALNTAVSAVVEGLDITRQGDVDSYAMAIEDAVAGLVLKPVTITYKFVTGFGTFTGSGNLTGKVDAPFEKFEKLLIDGKKVDSSNYTVAEGSTVITLNEAYLKTLANGTYTATAQFTDGKASTALTVNVAEAVTSYTVKFDTRGGTTVSDQTVVSGGTVTKPANPIRAGYTFGGWYKDKKLTTAWDFDKDAVTGDMTLYAKWTATTRTTNTSGTTTPSTGDSSNLWLWLVLIATSAAGVCVLVWRKKRKYRKTSQAGVKFE